MHELWRETYSRRQGRAERANSAQDLSVVEPVLYLRKLREAILARNALATNRRAPQDASFSRAAQNQSSSLITAWACSALIPSLRVTSGPFPSCKTGSRSSRAGNSV